MTRYWAHYLHMLLYQSGQAASLTDCGKSAYSRYLINTTASLGASTCCTENPARHRFYLFTLRGFSNPRSTCPRSCVTKGVFELPRLYTQKAVSARHWNEERLAVGLMEAS